MFTDKYKPSKMGDIVGHDDAVRAIMGWFDSWKPGDKALLLYGPVGVGKTSIIQALAAQKGMDFIELNASDYRSAKQIHESIGRSVTQQSLFRRGKVFMIDEVDALSGNADRGGAAELAKLVVETKHPIIMTANKAWEPKLRTLRKHCRLVELKRLAEGDIEGRLKSIAANEGMDIERDALRELARLSVGDMRAAITDLESLNHNRKVTCEDVAQLCARERESSVYDALSRVFKTDTVLDARRALDNVDKPPEELFWWIETNVSYEYERPEELAAAFEALSAADLFRERIRITQNWRFLAYMIDLMAGGVAAARRRKYFKSVRYQYPTLMATLGRTRGIRKEQEERLGELSKRLHCSAKKVRTEFLPYLRMF